MMVIHGSVAPGFEGLREAFERCFAELGESGAAFSAVVDGRPVADVWGGDGFRRDSLVHVYSVTKPMAAFCVLVLVDRGMLGLDDLVARHWPEFGQAGKERVTVRQVLSHQAGLVALRSRQPGAVLLDWQRTCELLAAETPWWEPGSGHGEHALFFGHLGAAARARTVDLVGRVPVSTGELYRQATSNPPGMLDLAVVNGEAWRAAEIPAVNGHGTARAIARFYAGLVAGGELDGVRLVAADTVASMSAGELSAHDPVLDAEVTWGFGVWVDHDGYGMGGVGGSLGMADPALGLAEAYVTRRMGDHARADAMDAALRAALA